jgi:hypothetical protein
MLCTDWFIALDLFFFVFVKQKNMEPKSLNQSKKAKQSKPNKPERVWFAKSKLAYKNKTTLTKIYVKKTTI